MTYDQRGSDVIDEEECRRILRLAVGSKRVGHLALVIDGNPHVIPVNYSLHDDAILVRLGPGSTAYHLDGANVSFEIDHSEPYAKFGWSVVVEGTARLLNYEEAARLGRLIPHPIVMSPGMRVFSIDPNALSGRLVHRHHHPDTPLHSASRSVISRQLAPVEPACPTGEEGASASTAP